jgi:hypothetical protein
VWINPPIKTTRQDALGTAIVTPDDLQQGVLCGPRPPLDGSTIYPSDGVESLQ